MPPRLGQRSTRVHPPPLFSEAEEDITEPESKENHTTIVEQTRNIVVATVRS